MALVNDAEQNYFPKDLSVAWGRPEMTDPFVYLFPGIEISKKLILSYFGVNYTTRVEFCSFVFD